MSIFLSAIAFALLAWGLLAFISATNSKTLIGAKYREALAVVINTFNASALFFIAAALT